MKPLSFYSIFTIIVIVNHGIATEDSSDWFSGQQDSSDWVDPHDMFSFDPSTKTNVNQMSQSTQTDTIHACQAPKECTNNCNKIEEKLANCRRDLEEYKKMDKSSKYCEHRANVFFRRFAKKATNRLTVLTSQLPLNLRHVDHFVNFHVRTDDLEYLRKFADDSKPIDCSSIEHVSNVIDHVLDDLGIVGREAWYIKAVAFVPQMFLIIAAAYLIFIFRKRPYFLFFLICICWQWYKLYRNVIAEREKHFASIHTSCLAKREGGDSWFSGLNQWLKSQLSFDYRQDDPCLKHFKAIYVDPILEVNPAQAFSEVVGMFLFYPLELFGDYSGASLVKFLSHVPSLHIVWIAPFLLIIILVAIISFAGLVREPPMIRAAQRLLGFKKESGPSRQGFDRLDNVPTSQRKSRRDNFQPLRINSIPIKNSQAISSNRIRSKSLEVYRHN